MDAGTGTSVILPVAFLQCRYSSCRFVTRTVCVSCRVCFVINGQTCVQTSGVDLITSHIAVVDRDCSSTVAAAHGRMLILLTDVVGGVSAFLSALVLRT